MMLQSISNYISLLPLQTARNVLTNHESITQMLEDISEVDFVEICTQAGFMESFATPKFSEKLSICK